MVFFCFSSAADTFLILRRWWKMVPAGLLNNEPVGELYKLLEPRSAPLLKKFYGLPESEQEALRDNPFKRVTTIGMTATVTPWKKAPSTGDLQLHCAVKFIFWGQPNLYLSVFVQYS